MMLKMLRKVQSALQNEEIPFEFAPDFHSKTEGNMKTYFYWEIKVGTVMHVGPDFLLTAPRCTTWSMSSDGSIIGLGARGRESCGTTSRFGTISLITLMTPIRTSMSSGSSKCCISL